MKRLFVFLLFLTILSGCSPNTSQEVREIQPVTTLNTKKEVDDKSNDQLNFLYEVTIDPIDYMRISNQSIEEVDDNVFVVPIELTSKDFINFNTYSRITKIQGSNSEYYSLVFDFKNLTLSTDKCVYKYGEGINNEEYCSNFSFLLNDTVANDSFYTFSSNLLFDMSEEYWNNQHLFLNQNHTSKFSDVFTFEVIQKYLDSIIKYIDINYELNSSIKNDKYIDEVLK
ncbi:MAG: membrane lipoprotein lipid attachment site-containing protein [Anaerorhabdus sp.]|uniref:membrane lipoprotein lipid attachment site-containing protein n=1 Tax=Anaerorhabdus sp. TaxID=1872524 RepID=UPI002FCB96B4